MADTIEVMRLLIIEDDFLSRKLLTQMLAPFCECTAATSSHEGLSLIARAEKSSEAFDVVILELDLPEDNGLDFLSALKDEYEGTDRTPPKVCITSSGKDPESKSEAFNLGALAFLPKPLSLPQLLSEMQGLMPNRRFISA